MKRQVNLNSQIYNTLGSHNTFQKVAVAFKTKILQGECFPHSLLIAKGFPLLTGQFSVNSQRGTT